MRAVDTNVLVRLITRDDPDQLRAAEAFVSNGAWVSHLVLAETVWVLTSVYDLSRAKVVAAVEMLLDHKQLALQDRPTVEASLQNYRHHTAVGFSDCLVLEIARKAGHRPLGTFDGKLGQLEGAEGL